MNCRILQLRMTGRKSRNIDNRNTKPMRRKGNRNRDLSMGMVDGGDGGGPRGFCRARR
jgi:hypothetical protein